MGEAWPLPVFAHLPMLVDEQRKKLGKRWESVAVEAFREQGFLPEAFRNYLSLLGWSPPGDAEKVPLDVLTGTFRLEDVHHAPAFFDTAKCTHLNGEYIRELGADAFVDSCRPWVDPGAEPDRWAPAATPPWTPDRFDPRTFARLAPVVQERVATLAEVPGMVDFVFLAEVPIDDADWQRAVAGDADAPALLRAAFDAYGSCEWTSAELHRVTAELAEQAGRKLGKAQAPIRVAVTGRRVGPPLFETLEVMGRDEVLRRLQAALDRAAEGGTTAAQT
jgi:glutamyl-tRNA synthetase